MSVAPHAPGTPGRGRSTGRRSRLRTWWSRARKTIGAADTGAYLAINRLNGGPLVDRLLVFSSRMLDWGELWVFIALVAAQADPKRYANLPLLVLPSLWLAMLTVNFPIKSMFGRQRPFLVHQRARLVGRKPSDSSFPSGHTAAAVAGAVLLGPNLPAFSPLIWGFALVVAFSRVYLGVHFPADVLVGGVLGASLAVIFGWLLAFVLPGV